MWEIFMLHPVFVAIRNELCIHRILTTRPNFVTTLDQNVVGYNVLATYKAVSARGCGTDC